MIAAGRIDRRNGNDEITNEEALETVHDEFVRMVMNTWNFRLRLKEFMYSKTSSTADR